MTTDISVPVEPVLTRSIISERLLEALVPGAFWVLALAWAAVNLLPPVNFDEALVLNLAERWLGGERLYIDLVDVNPPLIFILNLVPAAIERITGISGPVALVLSILAFASASIWLSLKLIPLASGTEDRATRLILPPLIVIALIIFPGDMLGQREHLMVVAAMPYLLLATARARGVEVSAGRQIGTALFGAVGLALKPHFLAIPLLVEAFVIASRGPKALRDPAPWVLAAFFVAYPLAIWIWLPQYYSYVVPLVMSSYETIGTASPSIILLGNQLGPALIVLIPLGVAAFLGRFSPLIRVVTLAGLGASLSGVVQNKGWPYHLLPAQTIEIVLGALMIAALVERLAFRSDARNDSSKVPATTRAIVGMVLLSFVSLSVYIRSTFYDQWGYRNTVAAHLIGILRPYAQGKSVLVLSPGVYPHFPTLNYLHAKMAQRFETIWPLQGAYATCKSHDPRYHDPAHMKPAEHAMIDAVLKGFDKYKPPLVVVDKIAGIPWCGGKDFDLIEYFSLEPRFVADMANYDLLQTYDRYLIYKRRDAVPEIASAAPRLMTAE